MQKEGRSRDFPCHHEGGNKRLDVYKRQAMSMAISAVLTHSGYTVDTVQNGAEAVEAAAQKPYDCLIFDIMMPIKMCIRDRV